MSERWHEFRIIGKEVKRYWIPKGSKECLMVEVELYLKGMDLEVKLVTLLGTPVKIVAELWCRERKEPNATYTYENLSTGVDPTPRCPKCGSKNLLYPLGPAPSDQAYIECADCGYRWYAEAFDGEKRKKRGG